MIEIKSERIENRSKLKIFVKSMLKVGIIGFGGGSALIPVVEKEIVENEKLISTDEYIKYVVVSNITPGAMPPKLGMASGYKISGNLGMILGGFLISFPGVFATIFLLSVMSSLNDNVLNQISFASVGVSSFIIFLLLLYIIKVRNTSKKNGFSRQYYILMLTAFALTFGKEARQITELVIGELPRRLSIPIFDISTVNLLVVSFFIIFYNNGKFYKIRSAFTAIISGLYLACIGKSKLISSEIFPVILLFCMFLLSVVYTIKDAKKSSININVKTQIKKPLCFLALGIIVTIPCMLLIPNSMGFAINGAISVLTSFGGGEAYLSVADGILVNNGYVSKNIFYGQIVPIVNALPGPILFKILSGIGFYFGFNTSGISGAYLMSFYGFMIGLFVTGIVYVIVQSIYDAFYDLKVFSTLKEWILPVICGMLLTTILSMLEEAMKIMVNANVHALSGLIFIVVIITAIFILHKKYKLHDVFLILGSGLLTLCVLNTNIL